MIVSVLDDLAGDLDILGKGLRGSVDHDGGEAAVDAALADIKGIAVIEVENDGKTRLNYSRLNELDEIGMVGIRARALGYLKNKGSVELGRGLGNALYDLHVVYVEGADSVAAIICFFEHLGACYKCHSYHSSVIHFFGILPNPL